MESPTEDDTMEHPAEGDHASYGQSPPVPQVQVTTKEPLLELQSARDTLLKNYHLRDQDPDIKKFYNNLVEDFKEFGADASVKASTQSNAGSHKTRSSRTVKVHKIWTGKNTFGVDKALLNQLNCKELQVEMTDQQQCDIIILFCPVNSRVGSDVELAMRKVSGEKEVILILMHHTRDVDYSTAAKRWSDTFENVVFDVNVLYHETVPGLLKCQRNTEAIRDIRNVLEQYSHSNIRSKSKNKKWSFPCFW